MDAKAPTPCSFEWIYFARSDSRLDDVDTHESRIRMGVQLAKENPVHADVVVPVELTDVLGDQTVTGVRLRNIEDGSEKELPVAGVFVAIGHTPNTDLFADQVEFDKSGYIITPNPPSTANTPSTLVAVEGGFGVTM